MTKTERDNCFSILIAIASFIFIVVLMSFAMWFVAAGE